MEYRLSPSLMCANQLRLGDEIDSLTYDGAQMLHLDIMDGNFVPNLTLGTDTVRAVRSHTALPLDVHLMVRENDLFAEKFLDIGCERLCFHVSDGSPSIRLLKKISSAGVSAGIALSPGADERMLEYIGEYVDFVLVMTVEQGFAGQKFIPAVLKKISRIREMSSDIDITADGNISPENAALCIKNGASTLVAGTSLCFDKNGYITGSLKSAETDIDDALKSL